MAQRTERVLVTHGSHGRRRRGDGRRVPPVLTSVVVVPAEIAICKVFITYQILKIFQYFQNEVTKILGEIRIWGGWVSRT